MEDASKAPVRVLSCHGVAFESRRAGLIPPPPGPPGGSGNVHSGRWVWIPWAQGSTYNSLSRTSSIHFCDVDDEYADSVDDGDRGHGFTSFKIEDEEEGKHKPSEGEQQVPQQRCASKPRESRLSVILLDQGLFTTYKRLFVVCLLLNLAALVLAITGNFPYAKERAVIFTMGNILTLTLCRSEALLRIVFCSAVKVLGRPCVPLPIKTATTSFLQSLGGIHSSCGISSVTWLIYSLIQTLNNRHNSSNESVAIACTILALLCLSCIAAFPLVRHLHHNVFERTHRFAGWTALALLWAFIVLTTGYDAKTKSYDNLKVSKLVKQQELWLTAAITFFTILPWATVRRVPVTVTANSGHASIIKFAGGIKAGILGRISRSPLSEWHAFGIISDGKDSHMMLAGAVGDFTKGLVADPPSYLWVRGVHFAGLPYLVNMYDRVVLVATGSGICVFLSFLLQPCATDVCLVWVTRGVEQNFGKEIKEMISGHPKEKMILHDTTVYGRPNVPEMTINAAKTWKAEVVVVTSNPQGSRDVVMACKAAGIPAFGPIWDS